MGWLRKSGVAEKFVGIGQDMYESRKTVMTCAETDGEVQAASCLQW